MQLGALDIDELEFWRQAPFIGPKDEGRGQHQQCDDDQYR
jgi:hypothetical protein